jgi:hypothetical protein
VFIDDVMLGAAMTEVYSDGPFVAVIRGATDAGEGDRHIVSITNDYRGKFQHWVRRILNKTGKLLPSITGGSETVDDAIIA